MDQFARIVIGYLGCREEFARDLLLGVLPISAWAASTNDWDWLGHGIYFWEHSPDRALRWAQEQGTRRGFTPAVLGAVTQLGRCFDLLNEAITQILAQSYQELARTDADAGVTLPQNRPWAEEARPGLPGHQRLPGALAQPRGAVRHRPRRLP